MFCNLKKIHNALHLWSYQVNSKYCKLKKTTSTIYVLSNYVFLKLHNELILKAPITTKADDNFEFFFFFQKKTSLDI